MPPLTRPRAVLFDLDGTLTAPLLDFATIRAEMGIAPRVPILEALAQMPPATREAALATLLRHERTAAENATLNPGAHELLARLDSLRIPRAIVTRNTIEFAQIMLTALDLSFQVLITREDQPTKPHPDPLFLALKKLNLPPTLPLHEVWMVGDGEHDIVAGQAAGTRTILLSHGTPYTFSPPPCLEVETLHDLLPLLD